VTVTASQKGTTRQRTAAMQISDITIHRIPWLKPRTVVAGSGLPSANAQISSAR
jgi:hypothetical protein